MAETGPTRVRAVSGTTKGRGRSVGDQGPRRSTISRRAEAVGRNVGAIRDLVTRSMLAPRDALFLTRDRIEDAVDDAVRRGRMTRDDAQQLVQTLLKYGAKQTDDFLADLERLLGLGTTEEQPSRGRQSDRQAARREQASRSRTRKASASLPIDDYDELSAAQVQERLDGLTPAELRKLRDYERRHANRKTVLDPIERHLR
jgi:polyhydroxyalkanoate synthesis regulator phasin